MLPEDRLLHYFAIQHTPHGRVYPFLNCWGLVCEFYRRELGISLDLHTEYDPATIDAGYQAEREKPEFSQVKNPCFGDVIAFVTGSGVCFHVGVMLDSERFLHSRRKRGSQITPLSMTQDHYIIYRHKDRA